MTTSTTSVASRPRLRLTPSPPSPRHQESFAGAPTFAVSVRSTGGDCAGSEDSLTSLMPVRLP